MAEGRTRPQAYTYTTPANRCRNWATTQPEGVVAAEAAAVVAGAVEGAEVVARETAHMAR